MSFCHWLVIRPASLRAHLLSANVAIIKSKWPLWVIIMSPLQPLATFPGLQLFQKKPLILFSPLGCPSRLLSISWARNFQAKLIFRQSANLPIYPNDLTTEKQCPDSIADELWGELGKSSEARSLRTVKTWSVSTWGKAAVTTSLLTSGTPWVYLQVTIKSKLPQLFFKRQR